MRRQRGYALILVLMVLALLSVGLGALFIYQETSGQLTGNLAERRRVFYVCDGVSRAATVLAQRYIQTATPTTPGMIDFMCKEGSKSGAKCCATTFNTQVGAPDGGACEAEKDGAIFTRLTYDPNATVADKDNLETALDRLLPKGYRVVDLSMGTPCGKVEDCRTVAPIPNGPFAGMNARQDTVAIGLVAEHTATTEFRCATQQTITLGKIAMFQFFVFSDSPITDWHPGPLMVATGRLHANGDVCVGGSENSGLYIDRITASGDIFHFRDAACPYTETGNGWTKTFISKKDGPDFDGNNDGTNDDPVEADFTALTATSRSDAGSNWRTFATDTWHGHLLDRAHGVPALKLPIVGVAQTQRGTNAEGLANATTDNNRNARVLVDPVRSSDSTEVRDQKFAQKADIRIINGIWYLRNASAPQQWPGIPIWSDHGGNYVASDDHDGDGIVDSTERGSNPDEDKEVGQADLLDDRGWQKSDMPRLFSYYGTNPNSSKHLVDLIGTQPEAVISYGSLVRRGDGHTATWRPGVRSLFSSGPRYSFCGDAPAAATAGAPWRTTILDALGMPCAPTAFKKANGTDPLGAGDADEVTSAALVGATRSGFRDGHAQEHFGATSNEANVLPINFDVAALQQALASTRKGELGSYFAAGCSGRGCIGAPFNGIVYISATYPPASSADGVRSSEDGYPNGQPGRLPAQGTVDDGAQPFRDNGAAVATWVANTRLLADGVGRQDRGHGCSGDANDAPGEDCTGEEQAALPWMLCSRNTAGRAKAGDAFDDTGLFKRPACAVTSTSRPNAVRVINARNVNIEVAANAPKIPATLQLPKGLSIISNLPVYVVGDVNIASDPDNILPTPTAPNDATAATWWPLLVGGDVVHLLSNAWDDRRSRWGVLTGDERYGTNNITGDGVQVNPEAGSDEKPRPAQETLYYMEILGGWGFSNNGFPSGGIQNFPRFLEDWGGVRARFRGSLVVGHNKVYSRQRWHCCNENSFRPPERDWGFDPTLEDLEKQPPGAPIFDVSAVKQWSRE